MTGPQKIRFRRAEIVGLETLPSAAGNRSGHSLHRLGRAVAAAVGALVLVFVLLAATLLAVGSVTISSDRLTAEAGRAVSAILGEEVRLATGQTRLTFGLSRPFGVELHDVSLTAAATGDSRLRAGLARFSLRLLPLLRGEVRLTGAMLSDIDLALADLSAPSDGGLLRAVSGEDGLVGGDELVALTFSGIRDLLTAVDGSGAGRFVLEDVAVAIGGGATAQRLVIERAELSESGRTATVSVKARLGERRASASGTIRRGEGDGLSFSMAVDLPEAAGAPAAEPGTGAVALTVSGEMSPALPLGAIEARIATTGTRVRIGDSKIHTGDISAAFRLDGQAPRYEVTRVTMGDGRTDIVLSGAFGPATTEEAPHYYYNLVSGGSLLAPITSSEPALPVAILVTGRVEHDFSRILTERLVVATGGSEVLASGSLDLPAGGGVGFKLAVDVANLPTGHAKNLWPWFGAGAARDWTLRNVYGGIVKKGSLRIDLPASRVRGTPLTPENLVGHFEVDGARFDMAGTIPPMRDAIGLVDFAGKDVDISLVSGTVFTETGRTLAARDGSFRIHDTHRQPLVGMLSLDVAGTADAVAEIANYEPISISRYLALDPAGMAGAVKGHVEAAIPLVAASRESIDWKVDLSYTGLDVPQAFEGQRLSEADGTIYADPTRAVIEAKGKLNGVPADFSLEEPLGANKGGRRLIAELKVDDRSRDKLMPGLGALVSGPFALTLISRGDGASDITTDLTGARVQVPWIGWEKKAGIPASASFVLRRGKGQTQIEEFSANGRGFSAAGRIELDGSGFARADFSSLSLQPGDDLSTLVERRRGGGYSVRVRGRNADVRSVVGQFSLDSRDDGGGWHATDDFSLDLQLDRATGHHGEALRDLKLVFSGPGTTVGGIRASARTQSGAAVSIVDATIGKERRLELAADNAGEVLRFLDIYRNVRGGSAELRLSGTTGKALSGPLTVRNFELLGEQRLDTMVNRAPQGADRSLNEATNNALDAARTRFDVGYAVIEKGQGYLNIADGLVRGPSIGATFQGTVFDRSGNMLVTGTFMPAYGINRLFGEIPLLGVVLGNGRDRGLFGITFRLYGSAENPQFSFNPLSAIAPGIFRKIFEFQPKPMDTGDEPD